MSILDRSAFEIMKFFSTRGGDLIELGCGSNHKIRKLLEAVDPSRLDRIRYVPVDISEPALFEASEELDLLYQDLKILGLIADFTRHLAALPDGRKMIVLFGSTIGNFREEESIAFIKDISDLMNPDDRFLLGLDMVKPVLILEAAYNDGQGVTREFNLNILNNVNRELRADFNLEDFEHLAFFNAEKDRVEMHLRARRKVTVTISDLSLSVDFKEGETIHTESCRKYSRKSSDRMFNQAGLSVTEWYTDPKEWFSLVELKTLEPDKASP